ncbi:unnamed protein product, partial [Sphagnum balticum]
MQQMPMQQMPMQQMPMQLPIQNAPVSMPTAEYIPMQTSMYRPPAFNPEVVPPPSIP